MAKTAHLIFKLGDTIKLFKITLEKSFEDLQREYAREIGIQFHDLWDGHGRIHPYIKGKNMKTGLDVFTPLVNHIDGENFCRWLMENGYITKEINALKWEFPK